MTQKTISLNEKAYRWLMKFKRDDEDDSDLIIRLCNTQELYDTKLRQIRKKPQYRT